MSIQNGKEITASYWSLGESCPLDQDLFGQFTENIVLEILLNCNLASLHLENSRPMVFKVWP